MDIETLFSGELWSVDFGGLWFELIEPKLVEIELDDVVEAPRELVGVN